MDGTDEISVHMNNGACKAQVERVNVKMGKGTGIKDDKLKYIAGKNADITFKLEEHDTAVNDHSNDVKLPKAQLKDIETFLNSSAASKKGVTYMVLSLNFAIKGGISGALDKVPFASMMCVSPLDLSPKFKAAKMAFTAYDLWKKAGGE